MMETGLYGTRRVPYCRHGAALPACGRCNNHHSERWRSPSRRRGRSRHRWEDFDLVTSCPGYRSDLRGPRIQYHPGHPHCGTMIDDHYPTYYNPEAFPGYGNGRRRHGRRRERGRSRGRGFDRIEDDIWRGMDRIARTASEAERWLWREYGA